MANDTSAEETGNLYTAGECWPAGSYYGYGRVSGTSPACTNDAGNWFTVLLPHTGGNNYQQGRQFDLRDVMQARQPFANTCACAFQTQYAAIGLSWPLSVPAGASRTFSWSTAFLPVAQAPLTVIANAHSGTSLASGANGYRVEIVNPSSVQAVVSQIRVTLPAGFSYTGPTTGVTTSPPPVSGQTLTWNGPFQISPGGVISVDFNVTVSGYPGVYYLDATATADREVAPAEHTAAVTVTGAADLELLKTASAAEASPGEPFSYTLTALNHGPSAVPGATIHDVLPPPVEFVSGAGCSASGQVVTCVTGSIEPAGFARAVIDVRVRSDATPASVSNEAVVSSSVADPNPLNNTAHAAVQVLNQVSLSLTKTSSSPTVVAGGTVTFTLTVHNAGPGSAEATLDDSLPAGLTAESIHGPGASCALGTLRCTLPVPAGEDRQVMLVARAADDLAAGAPLTNDATVAAPDNVSPPSATTASATVTVTAGDSAHWTIHVHNGGPSDAVDVPVIDAPGPQFTVTGFAISGGTGSCDPAELRCVLDRVPAHGTVSIEVTATVHPGSAAGTITDSNCATFDGEASSAADSTGCADTIVTQHSDLTLDKTSEPGVVRAGEPVHYLLTVGNDGPSTATHVTITDDLPAGLTFVPGVSSDGCTASGQTVTCAISLHPPRPARTAERRGSYRADAHRRGDGHFVDRSRSARLAGERLRRHHRRPGG